jgi:hypothetical protein
MDTGQWTMDNYSSNAEAKNNCSLATPNPAVSQLFILNS